MEQVNRPMEKQIETKAEPAKRRSSPVKWILCIVLVLAVLAAACFGWCRKWNATAARALETGDLSAAAEAYGKDFLLGGRAQAESIRSVEDAYARGDYGEAAEGYAHLGEGARGKWTDCIHQLSAQALDQGEYAAAVDYAEQIGEEKQDIWCRSKVGLGEAALAEKDYALAEELFLQAGKLGADGWIDVQVAYGDEAFAAKKYQEAAGYYEKAGDKGREGWVDAQIEMGKAAMDDKQFMEAAGYFEKAGDKGLEMWSDAYYEEGKRLIGDEEPEKAIECLETIQTETRAKQQIGLAQLMIAESLLSSGEYADAISTADSIEDRTLADVSAFLEKAYYQYARYHFDKGNLAQAKSYFEKCTENETASVSAGILGKLLDEKDTVAAARMVVENAENKAVDIPLRKWKAVILSQLPEYSAKDLNADLSAEATRAVFDPITVESSKALLRSNVPTGEFYGKFSDPKEDYFLIESLDALHRGDYGALGTKPAGKCIIVVRRMNVKKDEEKQYDYAVSMQLMRSLPAELLPSSLEEVEYVVLLMYGYSHYGKYILYTEALQEDGQLDMYQLPQKNRIYAMANVKGNLPPQSFSYYGYFPPSYKSGGVPDLGDALVAALEKIIK